MTAHRAKRSSWNARHNRDPYVRAARAGGYRARAVFKLEQIDRKHRLIRKSTRVVDLGAAPGSWSQYAAAQSRVEVVATDLGEMAPIERVRFVRGDFTDDDVAARVVAALDGRAADLVLSDLAPNISGVRSADQARAEALHRAVLAFCRRALRPGGDLLIKLFEGEAAPAARKRIEACFERARSIKPDASRSRSREVYLLARGYRPDSGGDGADGLYSNALNVSASDR
ncbi:MAG: RlmE family RNA methyltransferase [bacterium]